jgi:hypothetical protein
MEFFQRKMSKWLKSTGKKMTTIPVHKGNEIMVRFYFTPLRMGIIKKKNNNKFWQGCGGRGSLIHCCGNVNYCNHCGK